VSRPAHLFWGGRFWGHYLALALAFAAVTTAQEELPTEDVAVPFDVLEEQTAEDLFDVDSFADYSIGEIVAKAYVLIQEGNFVRARALAEEIARRDPQAFEGHCLLGIVHHRGEANLPLALYHVKKCRRLFEDDFGPMPIDEVAAEWQFLILSELAAISGSLGRHAEKVRYIYERDAFSTLNSSDLRFPADLGWPLMRMRNYEAARAAVMEALEMTDRPFQMAAARTALCAIEAEQQKREAGYFACLDAAEHERIDPQSRPTPFTNAAEAALGMLRFDEAESFILEGSKRFRKGTVSNPWLDLTQLYLTEGRITEALDGVRRMFRWRRQQPAFMDQQNRAEAELTSVIFLLVAGHSEKAARLSARILDRPDRTGFTSSESEQMEAGNALVDSLAQRAAAEVAAERASWSPFWEAAKAKLQVRERRLRSWTSARRVATLLTDERMLLATLRPYLAGSMEATEWIEPEICAILGPGVVAAALQEARQRETLAEAEGYFLSYEAEIAFLQGRRQQSLLLVDQALAALPGSEVLLRARLAARGAQAARALGNKPRAVELFDQVLQLDPGILRRLGMALPAKVRATPGSKIADQVRDHLEDSPRFSAAEGWFEIQVDGLSPGGRACLVGPQGTRYSCAEVSPRAGEVNEGAENLARRLAEEFHATAFSPRLDLTQADLRSLDGSPTAGGGRSSERLRSVLSDLVGDTGEDG
jgi:tetratricopeptide (TPR) repeat protein